MALDVEIGLKDFKGNQQRRYIGFLLLLQSIFIVLFGFFVDYYEIPDLSKESNTTSSEHGKHQTSHNLDKYYPSNQLSVFSYCYSIVLIPI